MVVLSSSTSSHVLRRDYTQSPPEIVRGEGCWVFDAHGRRYFDAASGVSVATLGHGVATIGEVLAKAMPQLPYVYNAAFTHPWQEQLAAEISEVMPRGMGSVFFTSGGSEANESALKLARLYHVEKGTTTKYKCLSRRLSYHGCTVATLSLSDRPTWKQPYLPLLDSPSQVAAPYEYRCSTCSVAGGCTLACADDLETLILQEGPETVAAFIAEPVLGTTAAGVMPAHGYYPRIREICDRYDVLWIADEVLVGYGRTGRWAAVEHWGAMPDLITLGKALGAGYAAIAALVVAEHVVDAVVDGSGRFTHGFTYGGMPISCLVGSEVNRIMRERHLVEHVDKVGARLHHGLQEVASRHDCVGEVRGAGLMAGIEFVADRATKQALQPPAGFTRRVVAGMFDRGVIILAGMPGLDGSGGGDHIQLSPPYICTDDDIDRLVATLDDVLSELGTPGE